MSVTAAVCERLFVAVIADEPDEALIEGILERRVRSPYDASLLVFSLLSTAAAMYGVTDADPGEYYWFEVVELADGTTEDRRRISMAVSQAFVAHLNGDSDDALTLIAPHLDEVAVVYVIADVCMLVRQVVRSIDPARLASITPEDMREWTRSWRSKQ